MEENTNAKKTGKIIIIAIAILAVIAAIGVVLLINFNGKESVAGKYKIIELISDGESSSEQIKQMEDLGMYFTMELNEDGKGKINMFGEETDFTYDDKVITLDEDSQNYYIDDEKRLVLENDNTKMVFGKISEEEYEKSKEIITEEKEDDENKGENDNKLQDNSSNSIVGKYKIVEMINNGQNMEKEIEEMEKLGYTVTLELAEDKTGNMNIYGEIMQITYDEKNVYSDGEKQAYTVSSNGDITLEDSSINTKMVFSKIMDEEE